MTETTDSNDDHIPQSSADTYEHVDDRGIKIAKRNWTCPSCGDEGQLMHRPGSKNTCATCFWVRDGQYNNHVLADWPLLYTQGQRLLAAHGEPWGGTPGDVGTQLRRLFDTTEEATAALKDLQSASVDTPLSSEDAEHVGTTLADFA